MSKIQHQRFFDSHPEYSGALTIIRLNGSKEIDQTIVIYTISGIKAILQDSSVKGGVYLI
jgi:hypothetical protein